MPNHSGINCINFYLLFIVWVLLKQFAQFISYQLQNLHLSSILLVFDADSPPKWSPIRGRKWPLLGPAELGARGSHQETSLGDSNR